MALAKWIKFSEMPQTGKTKRFAIYPKDQALAIGHVLWYGAWRKFCFFPNERTVYEEQCLRDIAEFCEQQTADYKQSKIKETL